MQWSPQQDKALVNFADWYQDGAAGQVFTLYGYAGSGKSTLARHLAEGIEGEVLYGAFTGKAASVMRKKGCVGATTLHALLYNVKEASRRRLLDIELQLAKLDPDDLAGRQELEEARIEQRRALSSPHWELNPDSKLKDAKLLIVDEVSMVDGRIGADILSFGRPVLVLGDPAQLPPVMGAGFFNTDNPNVMLTEVHRTALDNPVLHLATKVRQREGVTRGTYGDSRVVAKSELGQGVALEHSMTLVGRNATRRAANAAIRAQLGYQGTWPLPGEKLVCLRNNHELGLLNGTIWTVEQPAVFDDAMDEVELAVRPEDGGDVVTATAFPHPFRGEDVPRWERSGNEEFTFGYALTCHKAQGSEWESVYIVDESSAFRNDAHRWLYTAITRASQRLTLVR